MGLATDDSELNCDRVSAVFSGMKSVASNEEVTVDPGSGDQIIFDQIIDLADAVGAPAVVGDGTPFTETPPAVSAPLIAFD